MLCERPWYATMAIAIQRIAGDVVRAAKCLPRGSQRQVPVPPGQILDRAKLCPADFRACDRQLALHLQLRKLYTHSPLSRAQPFRDALRECRPALSGDPMRDDRRVSCGLSWPAD